jgi:hypothetical protein
VLFCAIQRRRALPLPDRKEIGNACDHGHFSVKKHPVLRPRMGRSPDESTFRSESVGRAGVAI